MDLLDQTEAVRGQIDRSGRHLLSQQDRDPHSPTLGCFDRRYWGWKLVDFPESTFQRNVYPLAALYSDPASCYHNSSLLRSCVISGLCYAFSIQHRDGSFDQAFPQEHGFGPTAFLLHPLLAAYELLGSELDSGQRDLVEQGLQRAADFLCRHGEEHGLIANHLAGGVLALLGAARHLDQSRYQQRAEDMLARVLQLQSPEGWLLEYGGADPGYQTLCIYYLAQVYQLLPTPALEDSLRRAVDFTSFFVHPDGSFGGEYGSRRTAVFYPGGLALLADQFPLAASINRGMLHSIAGGHTVTLTDVDMGNTAPLLSNYICAAQSGWLDRETSGPSLPYEQPSLRQDFPQAGLSLRSTPHYYAVAGVSNGGVLKVFDKHHRQPVWDDGGYLGKLVDGTLVTTQMTVLERPGSFEGGHLSVKADFYGVLHSLPSPFRFVLLRLLNLTVMRSIGLGNMIKKGLVRLLISNRRAYDMHLERRIRFEPDRVVVDDELTTASQLRLSWLSFGRRFTGIHMASAAYFEGERVPGPNRPTGIDVDRLNREHTAQVRTVIEVHDA